MESFNELMFEEAVNEFNKLFGVDVKKDEGLYKRIKDHCIGKSSKIEKPITLSKDMKDNNRKMALNIMDKLFDVNLKDNEEFIKILKECEDDKEKLLNNKKLNEIIKQEFRKRDNTTKEENLKDRLIQGNNYFIQIENEDGSSSSLIIEKTSVNSFKKVNNKKIKHYEIISDTLFDYFTTLYKGIEDLKKNNETIEFDSNQLPKDIIKKILNNYMEDSDPKFNGLYQDIVKDFNSIKNEPLSKKLKDISKIFDKHFDTNISENEKLMNEMNELRKKIDEVGSIPNITKNKELMQEARKLREEIFKTKKG